MSRVITFSRYFPSYHPKAGEPTGFVEKVWQSLFNMDDESFMPYTHTIGIEDSRFNFMAPRDFYPKYHTVREGKRFKVGDRFSPRVWSGKPYNSKQIQFAPDIEIKKVFDLGMRRRRAYKEFYCKDVDLTGNSIAMIAMNDGLSSDDFYNWFSIPFEGQIICWNDKIEY